MVSRKKVFFLFLLLIAGGIGAVITYATNRDMSRGIISQAQTKSSPLPPATSSFRSVLTSFQRAESLSTNEVQQSVDNFLAGKNITAQYPIDVYKLEFQIAVEDGTLSPVTAEVFVPVIDDATKELPIIVYAPGTTGLDERCAPSREDQNNPDLGNYRNQMVSQASQGYLVVMPNYEGLDNPNRIHYYFNADLEARTLLGSARTLLEAAQEQPLPIKENALFFGGYSQGGHASFAAADRAKVYTPELRVSGIFGHGPTTDTRELLLSNPNLAPYFVYAYQAYYGDKFPADKVLLQGRVDRLDAANTLCVDEAFSFNSARLERTYTPEFLDALRNNTLTERFPEIAKALGDNNAGLHYTAIPSLILQGKKDPIVTLEAQQRFAKTLCEHNVPVTLNEYENLDHFQTRSVTFEDTNAWINAVSNGEKTTDSCSSLTL